jgi:uncharacterized protein (TIGR00106 family)
MMQYNFSSQAKSVLNLMNQSSKNIFLTGKAGTGKSTLLDYFRRTSEKKVVVLAPTGVSAVNIEGEYDQVFAAIRRCHEEIHEAGAPRISTTIKLGTRIDRVQTMADKLKSVENQRQKD